MNFKMARGNWVGWELSLSFKVIICDKTGINFFYLKKMKGVFFLHS